MNGERLGRLGDLEVSKVNPPATAPEPVRRRGWPRIGLAVSAIAVLSAVPIWIWVAFEVASGRMAYSMAGGVTGFAVLAALSCVLDAVAASLVIRDRARGAMLGYLALRALMATIGILLVALPSYALAAATMFASPRPKGASTQPHAFAPLEPGSGPIVSLSARVLSSDWRKLARAGGDGPRCQVCGEPSSAPIHEVDGTG
jgi:hypothetical protein